MIGQQCWGTMLMGLCLLLIQLDVRECRTTNQNAPPFDLEEYYMLNRENPEAYYPRESYKEWPDTANQDDPPYFTDDEFIDQAMRAQRHENTAEQSMSQAAHEKSPSREERKKKADVVKEPLMQEPVQIKQYRDRSWLSKKSQYIIIASACSVVALVGVVVAVTCWYKFHHTMRDISTEFDNPTGITSGEKSGNYNQGDRKLAQSAQMYHYQHQKQQMIALEKANSEMRHDASDDESEAENEEGDYTVYECPGLAPTGELEVRNPMFQEGTTSPTQSENVTGEAAAKGGFPKGS